MKKQENGTYTIPDNDCSLASENVITVKTEDNGELKAFRTTDEMVRECLEWCDLRQSYYHLSEQQYKMAGKCSELLHWDEMTKYCGRCGHENEWHTNISKKCPNCGKEIWPSPAPAVIVLIHKGKDEVLLVHARNFKRNFLGLVAGFIETGETIEEAVRREVKEETGLTIENITYFGSQPWPYPLGLMIGFNADYVEGEIKLQYEELEKGQWFHRDHLPTLPEKLSIARRLIDAWLDVTP